MVRFRYASELVKPYYVIRSSNFKIMGFTRSYRHLKLL